MRRDRRDEVLLAGSRGLDVLAANFKYVLECCCYVAQFGFEEVDDLRFQIPINVLIRSTLERFCTKGHCIR